jgi:uncharacterized protein
MKILYLHGFGSQFDSLSDKIIALDQLGEVVGVDLFYDEGYNSTVARATRSILHHKPDLLVGTSMGGYLVAAMGANFGIPFVSLNPAINPSNNLKKYIGINTDYTGRKYDLTEGTIDSYPNFCNDGYGLVLHSLGDEVIPVEETMEWSAGDRNQIKTVALPGGDHRFSNISDAIPFIKTFYNMAETSYL